MKRTAHRRTNGFSVDCIGTAIALALTLILPCAHAGTTNQIQDVRIIETQGNTVVSIIGSTKPEFTAFKLTAPSRLVIDIASSQIRGVPSLIDTHTKLLEGVAVSQYTVKGVPVSRIMIGFKSDVAYRVRIKGSTLVATLAGSPSDFKTDDPSTDGKPVTDAASRLRIEKAEQEIAALKDENRKTLESYKEAEAKAAKAENALKEVSLSAAEARQEAARAGDRLSKSEKNVLEAEQKAAAAARELTQLKREAARAAEKADAEGTRADSSKNSSKKELLAIQSKLADVESRLEKADRTAMNSRMALLESQKEANLAKEDARRTAASLKDIEQEALSARQEAKKAKDDAAAARREAENARSEQARTAAGARQAEAKAKDAEERLAFLQTEAQNAKKAATAAETEISTSKHSARQAMTQADQVKAELMQLRKEASAAKEQALKAEKALSMFQSERDPLQKEEIAKSKQSLAEAKKQATRLAEQASRAESIAAEESTKRKSLEDKLSRLEGELASARLANEASEASRKKAEEAASGLERKLTETKSDLKTAQKAAGDAAEEQMKASNAYRRAAKEEQAKLLAILNEKEKETVRAKMRADSIRQDKEATEAALSSAAKSLQVATSAARIKEENRIRADRALAEADAKLKDVSDAMKNWEMRAASARADVARMEKEIVAIKQSAALENEALRKDGDQKAASARAALIGAEAAERSALNKLAAAEARLNQHLADAKKAEGQAVELETALRQAKRTIADQEAKIEKLTAAKVDSDSAVTQATKAAAQAAMAARAAEEKAERIVAESTQSIAAAEADSKARAAQGASEENNRPNRRLTMEEKRQARLKVFQGKNGSEDEKRAESSADNSALKAEKSTGVAAATITAVEFSAEKTEQKVIIKTSRPLEYAVKTDAKGNASLLFNDVKLAPLLERTLDVTDFGGVIGSVSSYQKNTQAIVEVGVSRAALSTINRNKNQIELIFQDKLEAKSGVKMPQTPLGSHSRTVAMESGDTYANPHERTAASSIGSSAGAKKRYSGRHVDLDFKDADIHNILRLLSDVGRVNIITGDDVRGSVTIRMRDVAWDHALDIILQAKQLGMVREGNLIRVAPQSVLEQEREMEIARRKQRIALEPLETRLIPISYATAGELMPRAQDLLSERGKLSVDARTNVIIARDTKDTLNQVEALIRNLDTQTPQVLIESRIVEATSLYSREIGIQWGGDFSASPATGNPTGLAFPNSIGLAGGATDSKTPMEGLSTSANGQPNPNFGVNMPAPVGTNSGGALGITLGSIANNANLSLRLSAMEETGTLRILSSPKILTLDNREAHIEQGTLIPYSQVSAQGVQTAFKEAKLNLTVTPHVTADGSVLLKMRVMRDEPDFNNTGAGGDPTILKREAETELLVSDGHTAVIGGIFTRNAGTSYKKVPFFADIPIIGWLFKKKSDSDRRSEMLIFITPRIVNRAESIGR